MKNRKENKILISDDIKTISSSGCDKLAEMRGCDLQSLLSELDDLYLTLRPKINIDKRVTFGMEIEYENADYYKITNKINDINNEFLTQWHSGTDCTVSGEVRSPVCADTEQTWKDLKAVCGSMRNEGATAFNCAGGHIHVGSPILTKDKDCWLRFLKVWTLYEKVIYRFSYGDKLFFRKKGLQYARPIAGSLYKLIRAENYDSYNIFEEIITDPRRRGVNFCNVNSSNLLNTTDKNTIEFRCPNGSVEEVIWQNNVNLFTKLLWFCRFDRFDDLIDFKFKKYNDGDLLNDFKLYGEIFLPEALEFSDMIFDNNLDKIYFLKQYLKNYGDSEEDTYARKFVK